MPVSVQTPYAAYIGNGSNKVFVYPFRIIVATDIKVYVDDVLQASGYSVSAVGNPAGGNVTFTTAPINGAQVVLRRETELSRDTDYTEGGALRAETLDSDFDRIWMAIQDVEASNDTTVVTQESDTRLITSFSNVLADDPLFDNGPGFQAALNAVIGTGITLLVPPGTFYFATGFTLNSDNVLTGFSDRNCTLRAVVPLTLVTLNTTTLKPAISNLILHGGGSTDPLSQAITAGDNATNALKIVNIRLISDTWYNGFYSDVETDLLVIDRFYNVGGIVGNAFIKMHLANNGLAYSGCPILRNCNSGNQKIQYLDKNKYGISLQGVNSLKIENCIINGFGVNYDIQSQTPGPSDRQTLGVVIENSMSEEFRTFVMDFNPWQSNRFYSAGQTTRVIPVVANGYVYECSVSGTSGVTEPSWPTTINATVTDGSITWKCQGLNSRRWQATKTYTAGMLVKGTKANARMGWVWQSSGGTSGATEPNWGTPGTVDYGTTVADGSITWTAVTRSVGLRMSGADNNLKVRLVNHAMGPVLTQYEVETGALHLENVSSYAAGAGSVATSDVSFQYIGAVNGVTFSAKNSQMHGNFQPFVSSVGAGTYATVLLDNAKISYDTLGLVDTSGSGVFGYYLGDANLPRGGGDTLNGAVTLNPKTDRVLTLDDASVVTIADTNPMHKGKELHILALTSAGVTVQLATGSFSYQGRTYSSIGLDNSGAHLVLRSKTTGWEIIHVDAPRTARFRNTQTQNTSLGGFTAGAWVAREYNDESDPSSIGGFLANQFTLKPGLYLINAAATGYAVGQHGLRLYSVTGSASIASGPTSHAPAGVQSIAVLDHIVHVTATTTFEIQHNCTTTNATNGLGLAANLSAEVFATLIITKYI
jgi:hypothetical protein